MCGHAGGPRRRRGSAEIGKLNLIMTERGVSRLNGLVLGFKHAEVDSLAAEVGGCLPSVTIGSAAYPGFWRWRFASDRYSPAKTHVYGKRNVPEVFDPVVGRDRVDVVNGLFGKLSVMERPNRTMREVRHRRDALTLGSTLYCKAVIPIAVELERNWFSCDPPVQNTFQEEYTVAKHLEFGGHAASALGTLRSSGAGKSVVESWRPRPAASSSSFGCRHAGI